MPTVVVTDYTFPDLDFEKTTLNAVNATLIATPHTTQESLIQSVKDADAVLVQFAPVTRPVIEAMNRAKVIVRYGIGVDNVDLDAAREKKIPVCNVPDYCIDEVADHTLAFILGITRQVVPNTQLIREGNWGLATELGLMSALRDQTVGLIGLGRIGQEVAKRLRPFKCRVLVYDPMADEKNISALACQKVELPQLFSQSNIISLHCPSTDDTRKIINSDSIAQMQRGSILINVGRGDLVDTQALEVALASGHLSAAAIDVCDPEPIPLESPLRTLPNVITASHIASASPTAVQTLRTTAAEIALKALLGEPLPNIVNGV